MDSEKKEVRFDYYCKKCKHHALKESKDPCNECLETPVREGTYIPERFEAKQ